MLVLSLLVHDTSEIEIISVISVFFIIFKILLTFYIIEYQLVILIFFLFGTVFVNFVLCVCYTFIYVT